MAVWGFTCPCQQGDKASQQRGGRKGQLTLRRGTAVPSGENECKADRNHRGGPLVNIFSLFPPCSFHGILRVAQDTLSGNPSWKHLSERLLTLPPCSFLSQELPGCQGNLPGLPTQPCGPWDSKASGSKLSQPVQPGPYGLAGSVSHILGWRMMWCSHGNHPDSVETT